MAVCSSASAPLTAESPTGSPPLFGEATPPTPVLRPCFLGAGCVGGPFTRPNARAAIAACRFSTFPLSAGHWTLHKFRGNNYCSSNRYSNNICNRYNSNMKMLTTFLARFWVVPPVSCGNLAR